MIGLTPAQADLHRIICELHDAGARITYRLLMDEMGQRSTRAVHWLALALRERGWLAPGPRLVPLRRLPDPPPEDCRLSITIAGDAYLYGGCRHARRAPSR